MVGIFCCYTGIGWERSLPKWQLYTELSKLTLLGSLPIWKLFQRFWLAIILQKIHAWQAITDRFTK